MNIKGFQKLSLVDYDGMIGCTIFLGGCNFRCPFCHNSPLVKENINDPTIPFEEILKYLEKRKGIIQAVCVTGGEPTITRELKEMLVEIKKRGYFVKLDTNGTNLFVLKDLLESNLVDYVAMDIKNSLNKYNLTTDSKIDVNIIKNTVDYLINSNYNYEFRTTLVYEFHTEEDIVQLGKLIKGAKKLFLQKFVNNDNCINNSLSEVSHEKAILFKNILDSYVDEVYLRGY